MLVVATIFLTASSGLADLKVTPEGHLSTLTGGQEGELFQILLREQHTPQDARAFVQKAIIIDP
jgi:hypothetical protein